MVSGSPQRTSRKTFTVEEANATLPLVRAITKDLVTLAHEVMERQRYVHAVRRDRPEGVSDIYGEELDQVERDLRDENDRLGEYIEELRELGAEPKSLTEGLVDFPALRGEQPVHLCWKLGEPEVLFWHPRDKGFADRQPISGETDT